MATHTGARHFHEELAQLKTLLLDMSTLAEELVKASVQALRDRDPAKAQAVILGDRELDALEMEVDDACIQLLALQQPMARDLRLITMAMKISNDLERVGDHAVNIAETVIHLGEHPPFAQFPEIEEMSRLASDMLSDPRADGLPVAEIAFRCGFLDAGYFARLFRKRFGITPREWRAGHAPQS